jgi:coenzyme F420-reducing hydrogenase beta subunit
MKFDDRLILVDIFCHGVPSINIWKSFINYVSISCAQVIFRAKEYSWHHFYMKIISNGKKKIFKPANNPFYSLFSGSIVFNASCYECKARTVFGASDIRVGDFWGDLFNDREDGVSAVVPISDKGYSFFDNIVKQGRIKATKQEEHKMTFSNAQSSFKKRVYNKKLRDDILDMAQKNFDIWKIQRYFLKSLPFKKRFYFLAKAKTPYIVIKFSRKIYHSFKKKR